MRTCTLILFFQFQGFQRSSVTEIKFVAAFQHAHLLAKGIKTRHFRNRTELKPIQDDPNYDFYFQEYRPLVPEVVVKPVMAESVNPFPNKPWFLLVCSTSLLKTLWEKEKLLITSNFSFSHSVFYVFRELSSIFITFEIVVCKLFQFGSLKFVVW